MTGLTGLGADAAGAGLDEALAGLDVELADDLGGDLGAAFPFPLAGAITGTMVSRIAKHRHCLRTDFIIFRELVFVSLTLGCAVPFDPECIRGLLPDEDLTTNCAFLPQSLLPVSSSRPPVNASIPEIPMTFLTNPDDQYHGHLAGLSH